MSTESVRNEIGNTIQKAITKAKGEIKAQGKKKIMELKQKIPSPQEVVDELKSQISLDSCTGKGKEDFEKKIKAIQSKIDKIQKTLDKAVDKLDGVDAKLRKITDPSGVLAKINQLASVLNPIIATLGIAVTIAKILVKIYGHIPLPPNGAGPPSGPIFLAKEIADIAGGKVAEFSALILSLGLIVQLYTNKINKIINLIQVPLAGLKKIKAMVDKLAALLLYLKLEHEAACEDFLKDGNDGATGTGLGDGSGNGNTDGTGGSGGWGSGGLGVNTIDGNNIDSLADGMSLEDLLANSEALYADLLSNLQLQGTTRALEKVSRLERETKEWVLKYNISFKIINI
tara:strand:+ start:1940 stop:2968 length:1029 start_codon:yes stop_codon:yes gene_type:complete